MNNIRLRRNRSEKWLREMLSETVVSCKDLIQPFFVVDGKGVTDKIDSMPDVYRYSIDKLVDEVKKTRDVGIPAVAIFPVTKPELKDEFGSEALNPNNLVCRALAELKTKVDGIGLIADVALDPYTSHGHDGILHNDRVLNDETVEILCMQAINQAVAGADIIAPSDMMDFRVGRIRESLDSKSLQNVKILSYAVKYASAFYGPFRDAVGSKSALKSSGKHDYQMDPANIKEAFREVEQDISEGADMIMIKPAMAYLDIISEISNAYKIPVLAYQVSGEYAMLKAAALNGWLDFEKVMLESLLSIKRAGASAIFTYSATEIAKKLQ